MAELQSLPLFHRIDGQQVLVLGEGEAAEPKRRLVERAGGIILDDQQRAIDEGVRIAFVAYDDRSACEVAAINLRCAGMLVNVVDRPELCDFTTPSILDRNPVLIAVGTGGASAGLSKHVRLRLERILPPTLGRLAEALFAARDKLRARFPEGGDRRRALDDALRQGGALDVLEETSHERVDAWHASAGDAPADRIETVMLTSADPDDLTVREARWLGEADRLLLDGDVPQTILARARADAERVVMAEKGGAAASGRAAAPGDSVPGDSPASSGAANGLTVILQWQPKD